MPDKFAFELKAGVNGVRTAVAGRLLDLTPDNTPYITADADAAAALSEVDGLKAVESSNKKEK